MELPVLGADVGVGADGGAGAGAADAGEKEPGRGALLPPVLQRAVGPELGLQPVQGPLGVGWRGVVHVPRVRRPP